MFLGFLQISLSLAAPPCIDTPLWMPGADAPETRCLRAFKDSGISFYLEKDGPEPWDIVNWLEAQAEMLTMAAQETLHWGSFCDPKIEPLSLIFVRSITGYSEQHREGFVHPKNPGALIEISHWEDRAVQSLLAHEAVHIWCRGVFERTSLEYWKEEGLADFVAYQASGDLPKADLYSYFTQASCDRGLYGGSFLYFLAQSLAKQSGAPWQEQLTSLHMGARKDLIYGELSLTALAPSCPATYPQGILGKLEGAQWMRQLWRTPWGSWEIQAEGKNIGAKPTQVFSWWSTAGSEDLE